jgi:cation transport ATPase
MKPRLACQYLVHGIASAVLAVPIGAILWFELVYLWFGLTGKEPAAVINMTAFTVAFGIAFGWPLYRTRLLPELLRRGCRLGIMVSVLLPVVSIVVLLVWENSVRPDLGMGGLMLYNMPFVSLAAAIVLVALFSLGHWLATPGADY